MGFLDVLFGGLSSLTGGALDFGFQALANSTLGLSKAQKQQNQFNATEAQKGRDFSAQQAEIQRDWQEEMYSQYNSLQGKVAQAREAGVNPLHAVTGSAVSPMNTSSSSVPSPVASSSSANPVGQISDMAGAALSFSKLNAEIENIRSQTRHMNAQALKTELESLWVDKLNAQSIAESVSRISVADVTVEEKTANIGLLAAKTLESQASAEEIRANIGVLSAKVANLNADTDVKVLQLQQILSSISNMDADTKVKQAMYAKVLAETRNEKLMSSLIVQNTHLSRAQRKEIEQHTKNLFQQHSHQEIMNAFDEYARGLEMETEKFYNPQTQVGQACKWLCESIVSVLSLGGYVSYSNVSGRNTNTVTHYDGDLKPKHRSIGFK